MSFWKIVLDGPEGTPYSDGTFLLYLHSTESYPTFPPEVRFITQLHHPNVSTRE
jgi:ubiquitin-protein ligase